SSGDFQIVDLRECVEKFLGEPVTEVFVIDIGAHVDEWQDGDRITGYILRNRGRWKHLREGFAGLPRKNGRRHVVRRRNRDQRVSVVETEVQRIVGVIFSALRAEFHKTSIRGNLSSL